MPAGWPTMSAIRMSSHWAAQPGGQAAGAGEGVSGQAEQRPPQPVAGCRGERYRGWATAAAAGTPARGRFAWSGTGATAGPPGLGQVVAVEASGWYPPGPGAARTAEVRG